MPAHRNGLSNFTIGYGSVMLRRDVLVDVSLLFFILIDLVLPFPNCCTQANVVDEAVLRVGKLAVWSTYQTAQRGLGARDVWESTGVDTLY